MTQWDAIDTLTAGHMATHIDSSIHGSHASGHTHLIDIEIPASLYNGWDTDAEVTANLDGTNGLAVSLQLTSPFKAVLQVIIDALKVSYPQKEIDIDGGLKVEVVTS